MMHIKNGLIVLPLQNLNVTRACIYNHALNPHHLELVQVRAIHEQIIIEVDMIGKMRRYAIPTLTQYTQLLI